MAPLRALLTAFLLLAVTAIQAASASPVVIAVDATLDQEIRAIIDPAIKRIAAALPHDDELALIVFDEIVLGVVPLSIIDAALLDAIEETLSVSAQTTDANLAIGLERGIAELHDRGAAHLLLFANARLAGADETDVHRYGQWYREILLPDAAESGIAVTLVSPRVSADTSLIDDLEAARSDNASFFVGGDAGMTVAADVSRTLLGRINGAPIDLIARVDDDLADDIVVADSGVAEDVPVPSEPVSSDPVVSDAVIGGDLPRSADGRVMLTRYMMIAAGLIALFLSAVMLTRRLGARAQLSETTRSGASTVKSSTYLPLHVAPSQSLRPAPRPGVAAAGTGSAANRRATATASCAETGERMDDERMDDTGPTHLATGAVDRADVTMPTRVATARDITETTRLARNRRGNDQEDELELLEALTAGRDRNPPD